MTDFQQKLLQMFKWLTAFLEEKKITYFMVAGTLLGAIRHRGFIPWDDDIDIALPREEYNRFIKCFEANGSPYRLETPYDGSQDFLYTYSKLYDTSTTLIERQKNDLRRGLFIDIFPLDGAGNDRKNARRLFNRIHRKTMFLMCRVCAVRKERQWYKNLSIRIMRLVPFIRNKPLSLSLDKMASHIPYNESSFVANFKGSYGGKEIMEKRIFGSPKKYQFEDIEAYGPEHFDEYLKHIYGDWRKLPPVEKRGIQHDFAFVDLNHSYLNEVENNG